MAVAVSPEPLLKSQPDVNKLNSFTSPIITVTKHKAARGTPGTSVVPSQSMRVAQILELPATLPLQYGSGYYKFTVADTAGGDSDAWMVALGPEQPEVSSMPGPPSFPPGAGMSAPPPGAPAIDPNVVKQIAPGYYYNTELNLLTTPWRQTLSWSPQDPWPQPPANQHQQQQQPHLSLVPQNATPWNWQQPGWPGSTGWGGYPVNSETDELKQLRETVSRQERQRELDQIREEQRRRDEERDRREEERSRRFETLLERVMTKPSGPSEAELGLRREAEMNQRRLDDLERRREEDVREQRRAGEARAAEERHREEMQSMRESVREATANKSDPLMSLFSTILQTQSTNGQESARMIRDASAATTAAAERSTAHILDLARASKDSANESSKTVLEGMKGLMEMQTGVYNQLLEVAGSSGQPAWVGLASEAMQKIGSIGQALAERNAREAAQAEYVPPPRPRQQAPQQQQTQAQPTMRQPPQARQVQQPATPQPIAPPPTGRPGHMDTGGRPAGTIFDPKTEEFVLADGMRVKQAGVEREGWKKSIAEAVRVRGQQAGQVQQQEPATVEMNGAGLGMNGSAAPVNAQPPAANKRGRKKTPQVQQQESAPAAPGTAFPPPANPTGYTLAELRGVDPDHVAEAIEKIPDDHLFGALWEYVPDLRRSADPKQIVQYVLQGKAFLDNSGKSAPAMDLLAGEQLQVFVYRLLPQASEEFRESVIDTLAEAMGLTDSGDEDEAE